MLSSVSLSTTTHDGFANQFLCEMSEKVSERMLDCIALQHEWLRQLIQNALLSFSVWLELNAPFSSPGMCGQVNHPPCFSYARLRPSAMYWEHLPYFACRKQPWFCASIPTRVEGKPHAVDG
jgi:hypothetical protein